MPNHTDQRSGQGASDRMARAVGRAWIIFGVVSLAMTLAMGALLGDSLFIDGQITRAGRSVSGHITGVFPEPQKGSSLGGLSSPAYRLRYVFTSSLPGGAAIEGVLQGVPERDVPEGMRYRVVPRDPAHAPRVVVEYNPVHPEHNRVRGHAYGSMSGSPVARVVMLLGFLLIQAAVLSKGVGIVRQSRSGDRP